MTSVKKVDGIGRRRDCWEKRHEFSPKGFQVFTLPNTERYFYTKERMIKLNYALLAHGISIDKTTGSLTLYSVLEDIHIPKERLPIVIPEIFFVGSFTKLDPKLEAMDFNLEYILPDGEVHPVSSGTAQFHPQANKLLFNVRFNGFPIKDIGRNKFRITWWWGGARSEANEASFELFIDVIAVAEIAQLKN